MLFAESMTLFKSTWKTASTLNGNGQSSLDRTDLQGKTNQLVFCFRGTTLCSLHAFGVAVFSLYSFPVPYSHRSTLGPTKWFHVVSIGSRRNRIRFLRMCKLIQRWWRKALQSPRLIQQEGWKWRVMLYIYMYIKYIHTCSYVYI